MQFPGINPHQVFSAVWWMERLFRRAKPQLRTRPIYHSGDAAILGHVFCSFLALVLQKELGDRCRTVGT